MKYQFNWPIGTEKRKTKYNVTVTLNIKTAKETQIESKINI